MKAIGKGTTVSNYTEYTVHWNVHGDMARNNLSMQTSIQRLVPTS